MFKYVYSCCSLFVAFSAITLVLSGENAEAKLYTVGGKVIAKTVAMDARSGLQARDMKLMLADFRAKDMCDCDFSRSDLRRADFSGSDLEGANFIGCDLRGANFAGANLEGANFSGADLRGVIGFRAGRDTILSNTIEPNGVIRNLELRDGETLIVRNYDAVRDANYKGTITLLESAKVDGGRFVFVLDNQDWNSTIRCGNGFVPEFENVNIHYESAHCLVLSGEVKIEAFSWKGASDISYTSETVSESLLAAHQGFAMN